VVPPGPVTVTSTTPEPAGAVTVMEVTLFTVKLVAAVVPNRTAVAPVRSAPVIFIEVPPEAGPEDGLKPLMVGTLENAACATTQLAVGFVVHCAATGTLGTLGCHSAA